MSNSVLLNAQYKYKAWRRWQAVWAWTNTLLGGSSVALGAVVAANTQTAFLPSGWDVGLAIAAPVLTFLLTTLKPQAEATACKTAARELEKALSIYDENGNNAELSKAIGSGIDMLNKVGSA